MDTGSAIFAGKVVHRRLRPRRHRLAYRAYWLLLDLDDVETLAHRLRLFSYNRFNLFSFHNADHGNGSKEPLRAQIEAALTDKGMSLDGGSVRILTMPRLLGFVFNPLSLFFCYGRNGQLFAIVYEVHNTFRERHSYVIAVARNEEPHITQRCAKRFYVSPFLEMNLSYTFQVVPPGQRVAITIAVSDVVGPVLVASLSGRRRPLMDSGLARLFVTVPLQTFKVFVAIHWHALLLFVKRVPRFRRGTS